MDGRPPAGWSRWRRSHGAATSEIKFSAADVKIFLDADPVVREQRRMQQQNVQGAAAHAIAAELRERDRRDRTRATSPLVPAADALIPDSTKLSEDEVLQRVEELVQRKLSS
jgi:cytidylate kinase